jgi:hypothetical protein
MRMGKCAHPFWSAVGTPVLRGATQQGSASSASRVQTSHETFVYLLCLLPIRASGCFYDLLAN